MHNELSVHGRCITLAIASKFDISTTYTTTKLALVASYTSSLCSSICTLGIAEYVAIAMTCRMLHTHELQRVISWDDADAILSQACYCYGH